MSVINFLGDAWYVRVDEGEPHADALRIASALGRLVKDRQPEGNVVIGYDSRPLNAAIALEMGEVVASYGILRRELHVRDWPVALGDSLPARPPRTLGKAAPAPHRPRQRYRHEPRGARALWRDARHGAMELPVPAHARASQPSSMPGMKRALAGMRFSSRMRELSSGSRMRTRYSVCSG